MLNRMLLKLPLQRHTSLFSVMLNRMLLKLRNISMTHAIRFSVMLNRISQTSVFLRTCKMF